MERLAMEDKVNILLVDDQQSRLLSYDSILSGLGHNLIHARSGREALALLMKDDFAVVLLDVSMPEMDGFETASLIHDHPRFEKTPIIFVTGVHVGELDRLKGYRLGAVDYVSVPVVPEILRGKLTVLIELYCKRRELQALNRSLEHANLELAQVNTTLQAEKARQLEELNRTLRRTNRELEAANAALQSEVGERQRAEKALMEASRQKDAFLALLAHELRNPLAPIQNAVQLMHQCYLSDPQLVWLRDVIARQLAQLTRLVDDLLEVSRFTRGTIKIVREPISIASVVSHAIEMVQPSVAEQGHRVTVEVPEEPLAVEGDLTRLTQVVGNLLQNAIKYTDPGGRITLRVRRSGDEVEIRVRDTGIGIPPTVLPKLFDLFAQMESTMERAQGGLGIGLALVRKLVELHGGRVTASSPGPGKGAEFCVTLPLLPCAPKAAQAPAEQGARLRAAAGRRILLADDNQDALESLAELLRLDGHEVHCASDGEQALQLAAQCQPEIALLDIGMPKLDGYGVAQRLRSQDCGGDILLVALTGWGQAADRRRSSDAGFDAHLVKPVDFAALNELLAQGPKAALPAAEG